MAESMDLDDAIASMKESGSVPDGFLFRIIVEEGSDLQPFGTSVDGLTVTHELDLNRAKAELAIVEARNEELHQMQATLLSDPQALERFARERYFMRRANEEVYRIVED